MYNNYTILLPVLCFIICNVYAQEFVDFPNGSLLDPQPTSLLIQNEESVFLGMTGANPKKVSKLTI